MIEHVYQTGLEKFAGDHQQAAEFTAGFMEQMEKKAFLNNIGAGVSSLLNRAVPVSKGVATTLGGIALKAATEGAAKTLTTAAIAGGIYGVGKTVNSLSKISQHATYQKALQKAMLNSRVLRESDPDKVKSFGETIFRFAPHIAMDANLLTTVLTNAIHGDNIDPMTIQTLTQLESRYRDTNTFTPKAFM